GRPPAGEAPAAGARNPGRWDVGGPRSAEAGGAAADAERFGRAGLLHDRDGALAAALPAHLRLLRPENDRLPAHQVPEPRPADEGPATGHHHRGPGEAGQLDALAAPDHDRRRWPVLRRTALAATEGGGPGDVPVRRLLDGPATRSRRDETTRRGRAGRSRPRTPESTGRSPTGRRSAGSPPSARVRAGTRRSVGPA